MSIFCRVIFNKIVIFLSESNRIKHNQLSQSSTQHTFCSVAVISCWENELACMPGLDKVLKTQELAPDPGETWVPLNPDGPRRPWKPGSPDGPAGPWVPLYPGGPGGPAGPASPMSGPFVPLYPGGPAGPAGPMSPLVPLTPGGPLTLVLPVVFFTYSIKKKATTTMTFTVTITMMITMTIVITMWQWQWQRKWQWQWKWKWRWLRKWQCSVVNTKTMPPACAPGNYWSSV